MRYFDEDISYSDVYECHHCTKHESDKLSAADFLQGIVDQLYGREEFNADELDRYMEEICHILEVRYPATKLVVSGRKVDNVKPLYIEDWKNWNTQYLQQLAK